MAPMIPTSTLRIKGYEESYRNVFISNAAKDVDGLKQRPNERLPGIQRSVIGQAIGQWRDRLNVCLCVGAKSQTP